MWKRFYELEEIHADVFCLDLNGHLIYADLAGREVVVDFPEGGVEHQDGRRQAISDLPEGHLTIAVIGYTIQRSGHVTLSLIPQWVIQERLPALGYKQRRQ